MVFGWYTIYLVITRYLSWYLDNIPYIWLSQGFCHGIWM